MKAWLGIACLTMVLGACSGNATDSASVGPDNVSRGNDVSTTNVETLNTNSGPSSNESSVNRPGVEKRRRPQDTGVTSTSPAPLDFRPGPENSQTATTMNEQGQPVEVRVFKDNAQLDRVEAVWLGANQMLLRITHRNGQTREVRTDRIKNLSSAPAELLIELAGGSK